MMLLNNLSPYWYFSIICQKKIYFIDCNYIYHKFKKITIYLSFLPKPKFHSLSIMCEQIMMTLTSSLWNPPFPNEILNASSWYTKIPVCPRFKVGVRPDRTIDELKCYLSPGFKNKSELELNGPGFQSPSLYITSKKNLFPFW